MLKLKIRYERRVFLLYISRYNDGEDYRGCHWQLLGVLAGGVFEDWRGRQNRTEGLRGVSQTWGN